MLRPAPFARLLLATTFALPAFAAEPGPDALLMARGFTVAETVLPRGPEAATRNVDAPIHALQQMGDGRLLAVIGSSDPDRPYALVDVGPNGTPTEIATYDLGFHYPLDLATDATGERLFLLSQFFWWNPPTLELRITEIDPASGEVVQDTPLATDEGIALSGARDGLLWLVGYGSLQLLEPTSGVVLVERETDLPASLLPIAADVDSSGALWVTASPPGGARITPPPPPQLWRVDPETGTASRAPEPLGVGTAMTISRRCPGSSTALCLQGGRFLAEVSWTDQGETHAGGVTPARSPESGLFWFFSPSNWELQVKVLDGCSINGRFWVFSAGSTSMAHELTVTDLLTGRTATSSHPGGSLAVSVADTEAFPNC